MKNRSNGYWILELNEDAVDNGLYGKIAISKEASSTLLLQMDFHNIMILLI